MQLYALDQSSKIIFAKYANKIETYFCLECHTILRCRGGFYKQKHFYHVKENRACRQNGKSQEHLQVQLFLQKSIGIQDCVLEKSFKQIHRIADVVWTSKKIIFEVQCSSILADDVKKRNEDYESLGFTVIWILHHNRFNQKRVSAAESFLHTLPCYFTNIDKMGRGFIYDNFWLMEKGFRVFSTQNFLVSIRSLKDNLSKSLQKRKEEIPDLLWEKLGKQKYYFEGDLMDQLLNKDVSPHLFKEALKIQKKKLKWGFKELFFACILRPYKILFNMALERACL